MNRIPIENIVVGKRLRHVRQEAVDALAQSIRDVGQLNPILVTPILDDEGQETGRFRLVAGNHRMEACKRLGMNDIAANISTGSDVDQRLAEIDENLCRADLTHLERAEHLAERKSLYEMIHPEARNGACGGGKNGVGTRGRTENATTAFSVETAQKTGSSTRSIQQAVRRANNISQEIRDSIRDVASIADNSLELDALASLEESEQKAVVRAVLDGKARSIREVVRQKEEATRPQVTTPGRSSEEETDDPPEVEDWKSRALEAEERCIYLGQQLDEINANPARQSNRGLALEAMLNDLQDNLEENSGEFYRETLDSFENRFTDLVFLIKEVRRKNAAAKKNEEPAQQQVCSKPNDPFGLIRPDWAK